MVSTSQPITFGIGTLPHRDLSCHKTFEIQMLPIEVSDFLIRQIQASGLVYSLADLLPHDDFWAIRFTKKVSSPDDKWANELFEKLSLLMPADKLILKECLLKETPDEKETP